MIARKAAGAVMIQAVDNARAEFDPRVKRVRTAVIGCAINHIVSVEGVSPAGADVAYATHERATTGKLHNPIRDEGAGTPQVWSACKLADQDRIGGAVRYAGELRRQAGILGPQHAIPCLGSRSWPITPWLKHVVPYVY